MDAQKNKNLNLRFSFKKKVMLFSFLAFPLLSAPVLAEVVEKILVTVNREPITSYDLEQVMANLNPEAMKGKKLEARDLKQMALDHLIEESLVSQEVEKLGIQVTEEEVNKAMDSILQRNKMNLEGLRKELAAKKSTLEAYKKDLRAQLKRLRFINQTIGSKVKVNEEDVQAYYEQNAGHSQQGQDVHLAQIVIPFASMSNDDLKKSLTKAEEVYLKIQKGGDFDQVMKTEGAAGSGDLGKVPFSGLSPQVANALQPLEVGGVTPPVRTEVGYLLVKLIEKPQLPLRGSEELKAQIRDRIYEMKVQEELRRYTDQLKSKAFIDVKG